MKKKLKLPILRKKWYIYKKKMIKTILEKKRKKISNNKIKTINFPTENKNFISISDFRFGIKLKVIKFLKEEIIIQAKEINLCFTNALRRILISEIETIAIEKVFFYYNSTVLNDETIAHRLGLIPIFANSSFIDFLKNRAKKKNLRILFKLNATHPNDSFRNVSVFSNAIRLKSYGIIESWTKNFKVKPVYKDILIAKLNPGQKLIVECQCLIGTGSDHAKFSPVGTSFYKVFPRIKIISEIFDGEAVDVMKKCPVEVFDLEELLLNHNQRLIVSSPHFCTLCKECLQYSKNIFPKIRIGRSNSVINFVIESTGIFSPEILFHRAIFLLVGKCNESLFELYKNFQEK